MPILSHSNRRSISQRLAIGVIYFLLTALGLTMVVPFLITLTLSVSNAYDYERFSVLPRYLTSREDRFVKYLTRYFDSYSGWQGQLAAYVQVPASWSNWGVIGRDTSADDLARSYLQKEPSQATQIQARDYADFCEVYPVDNSVAVIDDVEAEEFLTTKFIRLWEQEHPAEARTASRAERREGALKLLRETWKIPFSDFNQINFRLEMHAPLWQQSWFPSEDPKARSFAELKEACRELQFEPGIQGKWRHFQLEKGMSGELARAPETSPQARDLWLKFKEQVVPASPAIPYAFRVDWRRYLQSNAARQMLKLERTETFDIDFYNRLAGTHYASWFETPYPLPTNSPAILQQLWNGYVLDYFPVRLTTVTVTPALAARYATYLQGRFKTLEIANQFLGTSSTRWSDFSLSPTPPTDFKATGLRQVWADFIKTVPLPSKQLHSSEAAFQEFILARYGNLAALNQAWGTRYALVEEVFPPFTSAYEVTFRQNEGSWIWHSLADNYQIVSFYLFEHADAVPVTLLLIALSILCSLTINPMAAYALSRFNLRGQDKILLFLLATSAFPAMISAIPGFLLMRDLGILNTFFALILPGAANGMSIFILKGFFDSLPPELFEAATIDGAKEWQIFLHVTMPMVKPILAVNALTAFIGAYEGWQWALIVCQDPKMWTLAVWMYQFGQHEGVSPWMTSAGYVIISIPTLIVFLTCQRIILRGIIIPQMK